MLRIVKMRPSAILPVRGSPTSAGLDLSAAEATVIPSRGKGIVKTGLQMAVPNGTYGRIAPRSGLAWKKFIDVGAGVIDGDYRGEVGVVLFNHGADDLVVAAGDRVAQLVLERISFAEPTLVESLEDTKRGAGGFGSTGVAQIPAASAPAAKVQRAGASAIAGVVQAIADPARSAEELGAIRDAAVAALAAK
jgi:deoxyuridine 5'-triphosphate nucleotidohydrolase